MDQLDSKKNCIFIYKKYNFLQIYTCKINTELEGKNVNNVQYG